MLVTNNTILVIDDNPTDIHLLSDMLLEHGYQVAGALNAQDGFAIALASAPKAILLDWYMPGMDGMAAAKLLKSVPSLASVPILFITGSTELDHKLAAFHAGAVDYITKPFSAAEVVARLRVHTRFGEALAQSMIDAAQTRLDEARRPQPTKPMPPALAPEQMQMQPQMQTQTPGQRMVSQAIEILQSDLANAPLGADLAHAVGTNEKRLNEEFKSQCGLSAFEYLRKLRHDKACSLLLHSQLPMGQIAELAGFKTAAAFTFSFRQHLRLTPSQYRAQAGVSPPSDQAFSLP